jgi:hypothetical protein
VWAKCLPACRLPFNLREDHATDPSLPPTRSPPKQMPSFGHSANELDFAASLAIVSGARQPDTTLGPGATQTLAMSDPVIGYRQHCSNSVLGVKSVRVLP